MHLTKQRNLTKEQKEVVGLLSIGTFLEYFDLMLYVHMAVLVNELFFPKTDPFTASLLSAFSFSITFIFRPFGALIFGYIGDNYGRKFTVIITTIFMAVTCIIMAISPTYAEIGITASVIITLCRIVQGISSMGEKIGAEIYLTETFNPPLQYRVVAFIPTFSCIGTMFALLIASIMTSHGFNWRYAFVVGAVIAVVGFIARSSLRESADFADAKRRIQTITQEFNRDMKKIKDNPIIQENINQKTALALFLMQCVHPVSMYVLYIYSADILKHSFGFTPEEVIHRNLVISIVELLVCVIVCYLSDKIYPLKIIKFFLISTFVVFVISVFFLNHITPSLLFYFQLSVAIFSPTVMPGTPIFLKYFPIFKRFSAAAFLYATSRAMMYVVTSFGLVYLTKYFGYIGILVIVTPVLLGYLWGLNHFEKLEIKAGNYPQKSFVGKKTFLNRY